MRTVRDLLGLQKKEGDLGIEIEVEGHLLPPAPKFWRAVADGSLRGESIEYVLNEPLEKEDAFQALDILEREYKEHETQVYDSVRTGIHVHVNVQELSFNQLFNFITLFTIFEKPLVRMCGETREGNLFCLRAADAEGFIDQLISAAVRKDLMLLNTDMIRYSALNAKAVCQYGSLEFRSLRGTRDFALVKNWASLLLQLREASKEFETPIEIVEAMSRMGVVEFCNKVFGEFSPLILENYNLEGAVYEGIRLIQDVAYSTDWTVVREKLIGGIWFPDNGNNEWFDEPLESI